MTAVINAIALDKHYIDLEDLATIKADVSGATQVIAVLNNKVIPLLETSPDSGIWYRPIHAMLVGTWTGRARVIAIDTTDDTSSYMDDTIDMQVLTLNPVDPLGFLENLYRAHLEYTHPAKGVAFVTPYSDKVIRLNEYQKVILKESGRPSKRVGLHHYKQIRYGILVEVQSSDSYLEVSRLFDDLLRIEEEYRNEMGNYYYDLIIPQDEGENRSVVGKYLISHKVVLLKDLQRVRELDI